MVLKFVVGDRKLIEFQAIMLDPDPPFDPEPIDLNNYDDARLFVKQIGPRPVTPSTFTPKTFTLIGSFVTPLDQGYIGFDFDPSDLDTPGEFICTLKLYKGATEIWSSSHNFSLEVREF